MAKRIVNRRELRAEYEAAEAREQEQRKKKGDEEEDVEEAGEEADESAEEEAPKKKKKPAAKEAKPKRTRTPKVVRQRVVWVVCDNSHKQVGESFPYPRRKDADDLAARLSAEKKSTYFVQPKKEAMEE